MDGFIRECYFFQGMYQWGLRHWDEAAEAFRRDQAHTARMVATDYGEFKSTIFEDEAKFYGRLPELVELDRRASLGDPADARTFLEKLQALMIEFGPLDHEFFCGRRQKDGRLDILKQKAAGGRDRLEFNDSFDFATGGLEPGGLYLANLEPKGLDVDFYRLELLNPTRDAPADARPPRPIPLAVRIRRPEGAGLDLKVTLFDPTRNPLKTVTGPGELRIEYSSAVYGTFYLKVEPFSIPDPWPGNTGYSVRYDVGP
jgi:hypothetical protein